MKTSAKLSSGLSIKKDLDIFENIQLRRRALPSVKTGILIFFFNLWKVAEIKREMLVNPIEPAVHSESLVVVKIPSPKENMC